MLLLQTLRSTRLLCLAALILAAPFAARAADTCGLLTAAEVAAATGEPVTTTTPGPSNCFWSGKDSRVYVTIRDGSGWAKGKSMMMGSGNASAVSGLGDDAFFMTGNGFLYVLKGSHFIIVRVNVNKFSADQNQAAMKTLAGHAVTRM
jgi:hypothetical protein